MLSPINIYDTRRGRFSRNFVYFFSCDPKHDSGLSPFPLDRQGTWLIVPKRVIEMKFSFSSQNVLADTMDKCSIVYLPSNPKKLCNVNGTLSLWLSQSTASCSLTRVNGSNCRFHLQICHSKRTSVSSVFTNKHFESHDLADFDACVGVERPCQTSPKFAFESHLSSDLTPQDCRGTTPHQSHDK